MSGNTTGTGDWGWDRSRMSGYIYPTDAHMPPASTVHRTPHKRAKPWPVRPHPRPRRIPRPSIAAMIGASAVGIAGLTVVAMLTAPPNTPNPNAVPVPASLTRAVSIGESMGGWPGNVTAAPTPDPYTTTGVWRVGVDLPPGAYRVQVTGDVGGYWARCRDTACRLGAGLIENMLLPRDADETELVIETTDYMVKTAGVRLIPS